MTTRKTLMLAALISLAPAGMVMAQSQTMPQDTSPSSASSPSSAGGNLQQCDRSADHQ